MSTVAKNLLLRGLKGALGGVVVFKQAWGKTVVSKYPDMSGVKRSRKQKKNNRRFREAVAYARSVVGDAEKKAAYKQRLKRGQSVYHAAIREYMRGS